MDDNPFQKVKVQNLIDSATQELQGKIKEKQQKNKELQILFERNKESLGDLNRRVNEMQETIENLNQVLNNNKRYEEKATIKLNQDLSEFMKKVA